MDNLEEDERAEAYPHRELDTLYQVANAGMNLAIAAALDYSARHQVPAPQWVTERASSLLNALLHLEDKRARNKMREEMKEYQRNQLHYARYDAVKYAKEAREHLRGELEQLKKTRGRNARRVKADIESVIDRIGPSDETIYEEVANLLRGTAAKGGADAIKKSYQDLLKLQRNGKLSLQYYSFDPAFLKRIGAHKNF